MEKSLIDRLRAVALCHEQFEQGGGAADELHEAANRIEHLEQSLQALITVVGQLTMECLEDETRLCTSVDGGADCTDYVKPALSAAKKLVGDITHEAKK